MFICHLRAEAVALFADNEQQTDVNILTLQSFQLPRFVRR